MYSLTDTAKKLLVGVGYYCASLTLKIAGLGHGQVKDHELALYNPHWSV